MLQLKNGETNASGGSTIDYLDRKKADVIAGRTVMNIGITTKSQTVYRFAQWVVYPRERVTGIFSRKSKSTS